MNTNYTTFQKKVMATLLKRNSWSQPQLNFIFDDLLKRYKSLIANKDYEKDIITWVKTELAFTFDGYKYLSSDYICDMYKTGVKSTSLSVYTQNSVH